MRGSGDLLADRRFEWARALVEEGSLAAATDLLLQTIERAAHWAPAWAALAEVRERQGDRDAALEGWRLAHTLDADGALGAALHVSRLRGEAPAAMPDGYIRALFDDYAPLFDAHLVGKLRYRGPSLLRAAITAAAPGVRFSRALDLGCGTGLMGQGLAGLAATVDGVDLSAAMVGRARATGLYSDLRVGPLADALAASPPGCYDLVTAADVLVYVGDLAPVFEAVRRVLRPGGRFAFTLQTGVVEPFALGPDLRFAHGRRYVEGQAAACLTVLSLTDASTRTENGRDVPGLIGVAERVGEQGGGQVPRLP